ncbi:MAG TPA: ABC transporter substrate-binding protein [Chloroflexota bacterium]
MKLAVSYPEGGAHLPLWYAKDKGLFQKNGLDVDLRPLGGGPPALAALQANQTQLADITGSVIASADAGGADIVALATLDPVYPYVLEAPNTITTSEDLRGKGIAVRAFGDATDVAARVALRKLNLTPGKDVQVVEVNSEGARMAAVQSGKICCTVAQPQDALELESQGYHALLDFSTLGLANAQGVIATPRAYLNANKATVQPFMNALLAAIAAEKQDKPGSLALIKQYLKLDDDKVANVLYDYFVGKVIPDKPVATTEQFHDGIEILATQNEKLKGFDMGKYIDGSFLEAAAKR